MKVMCSRTSTKALRRRQRLTKIAGLALSLFFGSGLALTLQSNLAFARGCGGSSGCGGNTVTIAGKEITVAEYLNQNRLRGQALDAFKGRVRANLQALRDRGLTDLANELERGFTDHNWFVVDQPLERLGFTNTEIPFRSNQTIRHDGPNVVINKTRLNNMRRGSDKPLIMQELLERFVIAGKNVNPAINMQNVRDAAILLTQDPLPPTDALRRQLNALGIETEHLVRIESAPSAVQAAANQIAVPMELAAPITLAEARQVVGRCMTSEDPRTPSYQVLHALSQERLAASIQEWKPNADPISYDSGSQHRAYPPQLEASNPYKFFLRTGRGVDVGSRVQMWSSDIKQSASNQRFDFYGSFSQHVIEPPTIRAGGFRVSELGIEVKRELNAETISDFPRLSFVANPTDTVFEELGAVNDQRRLTSISLNVDRGLWQGNGLLQLRHKETKVPISIYIDVKKYADCLQEKFREASVRAANASEAGPNVNTTGTSGRAAPPSGGAAPAGRAGGQPAR